MIPYRTAIRHVCSTTAVARVPAVIIVMPRWRRVVMPCSTGTSSIAIRAIGRPAASTSGLGPERCLVAGFIVHLAVFRFARLAFVRSMSRCAVRTKLIRVA